MVVSVVRLDPVSRAPLTAIEYALLRDVRAADEDHGGLAGAEITSDEWAAIESLYARGLVEVIGEYGEAPDGEEDERDASGHALVYRITGAGVRALLDSGDR